MNTRHRIFSSTLAVFALATYLGPAQAVQVGVWNFNGNLNNDQSGGAPMAAIGGWTPSYVTEMIGGSSATVLSFPSMSSTEALDMPNEAGPNGPDSLGLSPSLNKWSIVMDVRFPAVGNFTALWETDALGTGDADYFVRDDEGIGTSGQYAGFYVPNDWTRIAVTIDSPVPGEGYKLNSYIDGVWTGEATTSITPGGKEAVKEILHLFADEDGETSAGMVNSIAYYGEVITDTYIGTLGGASAAGIPAAANQVGRWDFNNNLNNGVSGGAAMSSIGGWTPTYVSEMIGGSSATVLSFPAMTSSQSLDMPNEGTPDHFGTPPAPPAETNIWTIVMDVRFPTFGEYTALWETSALGTTDADYFVRAENGIGTSQQYGGGPLSDPPGTYIPSDWRRIAVTVDGSVAGQGYKLRGYIDGVYTGVEAITDTSPDGKEAIAAFLHLFADEDFETSAGFVNSVAFYDELLSASAIAALGGASAAGIPVSAPALDADFDNSGLVDGKDFLIWQRGFGIGSGATNGQGDADGNGTVNAADLTVWQGQYGGAPPLTAALTSVPEPAGWVLSVLLLLGSAPIGRHRA